MTLSSAATQDGGATRAPGAAGRPDVGERRAQLLRLGVELFSERGPASVSIDEIAERAGISRGLLYHYFPSKRKFYVAVVRAAVDELLTLVEPDPTLPPQERLRACLRSYFDYVARRSHAYLSVTEHGGDGADVAAELDRVRNRVVALVLDGLGVEEPCDALSVALRGWVGYMEGMVRAWLGGSQLPRERMVELAVDVLATTVAGTAPDRVHPLASISPQRAAGHEHAR